MNIWRTIPMCLRCSENFACVVSVYTTGDDQDGRSQPKKGMGSRCYVTQLMTTLPAKIHFSFPLMQHHTVVSLRTPSRNEQWKALSTAACSLLPLINFSPFVPGKS